MQDLQIEEEMANKPTRIAIDYYTAAKDFNEFNKEEIEVFIEIFEKFDADGSGAIDANELEVGFRFMGHGASKEEILDLLKSVDEDQSGQVEWSEFLMLMRRFYPSKKVEFDKTYYSTAKKFHEFTIPEIMVFLEVFREFDFDQSGTIDRYELQIILSFMGQGCSEEDLLKIIETVNTSGTGEIIWEEFLYLMRYLYPEKKRQFEYEFYGVANDFTEFSRSEIDVFIETFREFDITGSGFLDIEELAATLRFMGLGYSVEQVSDLVKSLNTGKEVVSWKEFLQVMSKVYDFKQQELEKKWYSPVLSKYGFTREEITVFVVVFRNFDEDGSGTINAAELETIFQFMGQGASKEQLDKYISEFNQDGTGEAKWEEFIQMMARVYSKEVTAKPEVMTPIVLSPAAEMSPSPPMTNAAPQLGAPPPLIVPPPMDATPQAGTPPVLSTPPLQTSASPIVQPTTVASTPSGWLYKLGGVSKTKWQKRWFSIENGNFIWTENPKSPKKKGHILLSTIISVNEVPERIHKKNHCFTVVTGKKTYFLHADTAEEAKLWMPALQAK